MVLADMVGIEYELKYWVEYVQGKAGGGYRQYRCYSRQSMTARAYRKKKSKQMKGNELNSALSQMCFTNAMSKCEMNSWK